MQSDPLLHIVLHAVAPQTYGEQFVVPPSTHVPRPLQVSAFVCTPPAHDEATQTVPDA